MSIRSSKNSNTKFNRIPIKVIKEALAKTTSLRSAARYANIPYPTFRKACIYNHIEYNSSKSAQQ